MNAKKSIEITCGYQKLEAPEKLEYFQGNLKELRKDEAKKLEKSILKHGFTAPVFVWGNKILDGHQRLFVLRQMISSGYAIDGIPVVEIYADSEKQAAEKLLAITSRYARVTDEGLYEFIENFEVEIEDISGMIELPEINMDSFNENFFSDEKQGNENDEGYENLFGVLVGCENEAEQLEVLKRLESEGLKCRALIS